MLKQVLGSLVIIQSGVWICQWEDVEFLEGEGDGCVVCGRRVIRQ